MKLAFRQKRKNGFFKIKLHWQTVTEQGFISVRQEEEKHEKTISVLDCILSRFGSLCGWREWISNELVDSFWRSFMSRWRLRLLPKCSQLHPYEFDANTHWSEQWNNHFVSFLWRQQPKFCHQCVVLVVFPSDFLAFPRTLQIFLCDPFNHSVGWFFFVFNPVFQSGARKWVQKSEDEISAYLSTLASYSFLGISEIYSGRFYTSDAVSHASVKKGKPVGKWIFVSLSLCLFRDPREVHVSQDEICPHHGC